MEGAEPKSPENAMYKPGEFFIGVIDFFGILVPGAVLLFLDGSRLPDVLQLPPLGDPTLQWAAFLVGAYVLGHFLLAAGVPLNRTLRFYKSANKDRFYQSAKKHLIVHSTTEEQARTDTFYLAYASVRLKSPAAAAEIERQMADYKLFRSLAIVFALDLAVNWWLHGRWPRLLLSSLLLALTAVRFGFLLSWTYRITFEYYELLREARAA